MTMTFETIEKLVKSTAQRFWRSHGGDIDELIAEANYVFVDAYTSGKYDPDRASFNTFLVNHIWYGLLNKASKITKKNNRLKKQMYFSGYNDFDETSYDNFSETNNLDKLPGQKQSKLAMQIR